MELIKDIVIILALGYVGSLLFTKIKLPGLLGMIIVGIVIGISGFNLISDSFMIYKKEIMGLALIVVLIKAGFSIDKKTLKKVGIPALRLGIIPALLEGLTIGALSMIFFDLDIRTAGTLAFIIAAVSPAVVIPTMVKFKEQGYGTDKGIPTMILASASLDDIVALTMFTFFFSANLSNSSLDFLSILSSFFNIIVSVLWGYLFGYLIPYLFNLNSNKKWVTFFEITLLIVFAAVLKFNKYSNGTELLTIIMIAYYIAMRVPNKIESYKKHISLFWNVMQIFLFVMIGAIVDVKVAFSVGLISILLIFIGLIVRIVTSYLCVLKTDLNKKERIFISISNVPKATIQATTGALPLAYGLYFGQEILSISVLSIVVTAPLGLILLNAFVSKLLIKE